MKKLFRDLSSLLGELEEFLVVKINSKIYLSRLRPYTVATGHAWRRYGGLYVYASPTLFRRPPTFGSFYSSRHRAHLPLNSPSRSIFSNPSRLGGGIHLDRDYPNSPIARLYAEAMYDVRAIRYRLSRTRLYAFLQFTPHAGQNPDPY